VSSYYSAKQWRVWDGWSLWLLPCFQFSRMDSSPSDATVIQEKETKKQVREST